MKLPFLNNIDLTLSPNENIALKVFQSQGRKLSMSGRHESGGTIRTETTGFRVCDFFQ